MITREKWDQAKQMLDAGASQRAIAAATGLCRRTIGRIERGELSRPSPCEGCKPDPPKRGRCTTCGAIVDLPCCACCEETTPSGPRPIGEVIEPLALALRRGELSRLAEIQARQRVRRQRSEEA